MNITNRHYVVDETIGAVVAFCTFGAGSANGITGAPDTHLFRLNGGRIRYVHTLTHLLQSDFRSRQQGATSNSGANPPERK